MRILRCESMNMNGVKDIYNLHTQKAMWWWWWWSSHPPRSYMWWWYLHMLCTHIGVHNSQVCNTCYHSIQKGVIPYLPNYRIVFSDLPTRKPHLDFRLVLVCKYVASHKSQVTSMCLCHKIGLWSYEYWHRGKFDPPKQPNETCEEKEEWIIIMMDKLLVRRHVGSFATTIMTLMQLLLLLLLHHDCQWVRIIIVIISILTILRHGIFFDQTQIFNLGGHFARVISRVTFVGFFFRHRRQQEDAALVFRRTSTVGQGNVLCQIIM